MYIKNVGSNSREMRRTSIASPPARFSGQAGHADSKGTDKRNGGPFPAQRTRFTSTTARQAAPAPRACATPHCETEKMGKRPDFRCGPVASQRACVLR